MSWITSVTFEQAEGTLKETYSRLQNSHGALDNIVTAHGLRPHTLDGHMALYRHVLHHPANTLAKSYLETIAIYVSLINHCQYCVVHHYHNLQQLLADPAQAERILKALKRDKFSGVFDAKQSVGLLYAAKLTTAPAQMEQADIENCIKQGLTEGEVLEINQLTGYFNYANRMVLGLGIELEDWHKDPQDS